MGFDLNWFKTIPGLLITGGVVLLIVALVIFIVTSRNNKKEKKKDKDKAVNNDNNVAAETIPVSGNTDNAGNIQNTVTDTPAVQPTPVLDQPVQAVSSSEVLNNVNEAQNINAVMENSVPVNNMPQIEPVNSVPVVESAPSNMPSNDIISQPVVSGSINISTPNVQIDASKIEQLTDNSVVTPINAIPTGNAESPEVISVNTPEVVPVVTPEVTPNTEVVPINTTPVVEPTIPSAEPTIDVVSTVEPTTNNINTSPSIYGGVSQIIPDMNLNDNNNHQIYGGANPLENTQSVPVIKNETVIPSVKPAVQPAVNVVPDTLTPSIPMPSVSVEPVNDSNYSDTVSDNGNVMPTPQATPVVPVGIPAVQVVATAPIMPPDNK